MLKSILFAALSCVAVATQAHAHPLEARQALADGSRFNLYAYGEGISGLRVFFADGKAQFGDIARSDAAEKSPVYFTVSPSNANSWIAHADSTDSTFSTAAADSTILSLPVDGSDADVVFRDNTAAFAASEEATVFTVYGDYVLIDWETANFYTAETDVAGVYSLLWSNSGSASAPVTLRTVAPSTDSVL